jgi:hypothetical protein
MAKLGARGTSMLHASGDGGVEGTQRGVEPCVHGRFHPTWPASSPWVTTVGATDTSYAKAASFSSGGFSDVHPAPAWQAAAIAAYKAAAAAGGTLPPAAVWNATGRAFPDVSAVGEGFRIVVNGQTESVAGTSCSTPTFAGVVALLNDARVAAGKKPLGWLNPLLYKNAGVFTDIAAGNNPGCNSKGVRQPAVPRTRKCPASKLITPIPSPPTVYRREGLRPDHRPGRAQVPGAPEARDEPPVRQPACRELLQSLCCCAVANLIGLFQKNSSRANLAPRAAPRCYRIRPSTTLASSCSVGS